MNRKAIRKPESTPAETSNQVQAIRAVQTASEFPEAAAAVETLSPAIIRWSKIFAVLVPLSMLAVMVVMISSKLGHEGMSGFEGETAPRLSAVWRLSYSFCLVPCSPKYKPWIRSAII